jgi:hypothetical protein
VHIGFVGKARREETTRRPQRMWEDNIEMDLRNIDWSGMGWTDMGQDRDK